jgi:protein ImuA
MLEELRQRLQVLQKTAGIDGDPGVLPLDLPAIDGVLGGGLLRGTLHEIAAISEAHLAAATGFTLGLASLRGKARTLAWIAEDMALAESGAPYGPGLDAFGLAPERLLSVSVAHRRDLMGAMEEALRCRAVGAVIGEVRHGALDAIAVRRLSLAAAESGALAFLLRSAPQRDASTAATRWIVGAAPSPPHRPRFEFGPPRFAAQLIRNRRGPTASWIFEWSDDDECFVRATPALPVAAAPADRPRRAVA